MSASRESPKMSCAVHSTKNSTPPRPLVKARSISASLSLWLCLPTLAQPLAAQKVESIPESARRPRVIEIQPGQPTQTRLPDAVLADGFALSLAAAAPLVTHPTMACLDERSRLFVADCVGVNWNKAQLEANPPNRMLLLEDRDGDGVFDKSTVFAEGLTFPQGACWLEGSLYVCSPPGLWRLTDRDGDGVADEREKLVDGFDYTGNAADVHGPFWNPANRRLYWCHGRKGHRAVGKEGVVVHEGLASGIWSCNPDGGDLRWHSLGCGDNPVEVDFTPEGDVLGVQNLYHSNPRGDTLIHFLPGGVYERPDMLKAIEGLPRTLEKMPVLHNFGHVAVSGCTLWRSNPWGASVLQMLVTHFNTGRLVRMELTRRGSTYAATENAFAKLNDPNVHLTDVLEDHDGSLLVVNTGGWFRIGCPSSLMAKPDITGAVYRITCNASSSTTRPAASGYRVHFTPPASAVPPTAAGNVVEWLGSSDPHLQRRACEWVALNHERSKPVAEALRNLLANPLDPPLEHAAIHAAGVTQSVVPGQLDQASSSLQLRRLLKVLDQFGSDPETANRTFEKALAQLEDPDPDLATVALGIVAKRGDRAESIRTRLELWIASEPISARRLEVLQTVAAHSMVDPGMRGLIALTLKHPHKAFRLAGLRAVAEQTAVSSEPLWVEPLQTALRDTSLPLALTLDAVRRVKDPALDETLREIADNPAQPLSLRLKCLGAMKTMRLSDGVFELLVTTLSEGTAPVSARLEAASLLRSASTEQIPQLAPILEKAGPLELKILTGLLSKTPDPKVARSLTRAVSRNPALGSQQESVYRTALSSQEPALFESIVLPALQRANAQYEAKRYSLGPLAERLRNASADGGKEVFLSGKGACIGCHQIGTAGRAIGPDLSRIGGIRTGRDLLESILFPSNTLARDYETHAIEVAGVSTITGVIRGHSAEGLLLVDAGGQETSIPHEKILSNTTLPESLMPAGLDVPLGERDLLDLVAYLESLR
jgi:putative membrane-bound dehydrogenase-like protein